MDIKIQINKNSRFLTIDNKPIQFLDGTSISTDAETIEKYTACELIYFRPIFVEFSNEYCTSNKHIYLSDEFFTSFSWQAHATVLSYISVPTPEKYKDKELDYQLALKSAIDSDNNCVIRKFHTFQNPYSGAENFVGFIITGNTYKKIFSELNKKVGRLHNSTLRSLGWK